MSISLSSFGALADGRAATLYTLTNASGAQLCLTDYGARVVSVRVPDRSGALADVALGFDSAADYARIDNSVGATIGRVGNRIGVLPSPSTVKYIMWMQMRASTAFTAAATALPAGCGTQSRMRGKTVMS